MTTQNNYKIAPSSKYRVSIIIDKIIDKSFDENDVRNLLLEIRDYLPKDSIIRDIAHFVAHPKTRDRGVVHNDLSLFAYKIKRAADIDKEPIKIKEMSKEFYEMIIYGIKQLDGDININGQLTKPNEAVNIFRGRFKYSRPYYTLKEPITRKELDSLIDIMKNVFCMIVIKPFLTKGDLVDMLNKSISCLLNDFDKNIIITNSTEIMICLMSVIQNVNFILYDKSRAYLEWEPYSFKENGEINDGISLFVNCEGPEYVDFSFCFLSAECKSSEYGITSREKLHEKRHFFAKRERTGKLHLVLTGVTSPFN